MLSVSNCFTYWSYWGMTERIMQADYFFKTYIFSKPMLTRAWILEATNTLFEHASSTFTPSDPKSCQFWLGPRTRQGSATGPGHQAGYSTARPLQPRTRGCLDVSMPCANAEWRLASLSECSQVTEGCGEIIATESSSPEWSFCMDKDRAEVWIYVDLCEVTHNFAGWPGI